VIFEIRTYNLKPYAVPDYEKAFSEAYPTRAQYGDNLWGYFHTEIGPLNQIVHIWSYESLQQRADIRAASMKDTSGKWPPTAAGRELIVSQENDIILPIKGVNETPGKQEWGGLYELRMYTYPSGSLAKVIPAFAEKLAERSAVYPVAGIFTSDLGNLNRLYQLFPYKDWAHRDKVRGELREKGIWPPHADASPISQLVRHMVPTSFSPLR
jgi:hypothetical protein